MLDLRKPNHTNPIFVDERFTPHFEEARRLVETALNREMSDRRRKIMVDNRLKWSKGFLHWHCMKIGFDRLPINEHPNINRDIIINKILEEFAREDESLIETESCILVRIAYRSGLMLSKVKQEHNIVVDSYSHRR